MTTYLWTKAVGAGALMLAAFALFLGIGLGPVGTVIAPALALVTTVTTGALLVWDLKRPERFLYIFLKPNPASWLVRGGVVLTAFAALSAAWLVLGILIESGAVPSGPGSTAAAVLKVLAALAVPCGALTAGYTAFLFGQAEGRDLWQSPLLFWHLQAQAIMVGAGALAVAAAISGLSPEGVALLAQVLVLATAIHVLMVLLEFVGRHTTAQATTAAHLATHGPYARLFWPAGVGLAVVAAAVAAIGWSGIALAAVVAAGGAVQVALLSYESVFVRAGQDVPLS